MFIRRRALLRTVQQYHRRRADDAAPLLIATPRHPPRRCNPPNPGPHSTSRAAAIHSPASSGITGGRSASGQDRIFPAPKCACPRWLVGSNRRSNSVIGSFHCHPLNCVSQLATVIPRIVTLPIVLSIVGRTTASVRGTGRLGLLHFSPHHGSRAFTPPTASFHWSGSPSFTDGFNRGGGTGGRGAKPERNTDWPPLTVAARTASSVIRSTRNPGCTDFRSHPLISTFNRAGMMVWVSDYDFDPKVSARARKGMRALPSRQRGSQSVCSTPSQPIREDIISR